jgi:hypothetical protein
MMHKRIWNPETNHEAATILATPSQMNPGAEYEKPEFVIQPENSNLF